MLRQWCNSLWFLPQETWLVCVYIQALCGGSRGGDLVSMIGVGSSLTLQVDCPYILRRGQSQGLQFVRRPYDDGILSARDRRNEIWIGNDGFGGHDAVCFSVRGLGLYGSDGSSSAYIEDDDFSGGISSQPVGR